MGRKQRIIVEGGIYHIIQRGNNRNFIFEDNQDKRQFFEFLLDARDKYEFHVLYYVLMDNHYHLLLESSDIPISRGIQHLNTAYSKYYNKKYDRVGGIYNGRSNQSLVTDIRYFYQLLRYFSQNPVKAGIVKAPGEYKWCAHGEVKKGYRYIINIEKLLSRFSASKPRAYEEYVELIEQDAEISPVYGLYHVNEEQRLADALNQIMINMGLNDRQIYRIREGDRSMDLKEVRNEFIQEAYDAGFKMKDIANHISCSHETVRKVIGVRHHLSKLHKG
ncbi:MAG: transposase [Anaerovoracaceae bacterium]|jgi:putative transposase